VADDAGPWWRRIGWFVLIWASSVAVLALVAALLRAWLA
jgi:Protein of unknown function (DUF2474)